eukprot:m.617487 g.617487  ORF g.617487 m.617487 type:complete len:238 (+) comp58180_c0_seq11:61-774(+)
MQAFAQPRAKFYAAQVALGLQDLHERNILYRDMKLENIMMDEHGNVRITDLGLSVILPSGKAAKGRVGTVGYMAPEVIQGKKHGFSVDWWGLGCVLYEMLHAQPAFRLNAAKKGQKPTDEEQDSYALGHEPEYSSSLDAAAIDVMKRLLDKDLNTRLGSRDHGFESTPDAVKSHPFFQDINWAVLRASGIPPPFKPGSLLCFPCNAITVGLGWPEFSARFFVVCCACQIPTLCTRRT